MLGKIKRFLQPPVFEGDQEKTRAAALLHATLLALVAMTVIGTIIIMIVEPAELVFNLLFGAILVAALLFLRIIVQRGHTRFPGWLLTAVLWAGITTLLYQSGGIGNVSVTGYFLIVAIASLILGARAALITGSLCSAGLVGLFIAESAGAIATPVEGTPGVVRLTVLLITLGLTTLLIRTATRSIRQSLALAHRNEEALIASNRDLLASQEALRAQAANLRDQSVQLETAAMVAREAAAIHSVRQLVDRTVHLIAAQFDFYHTGLFLLDEEGTHVVMEAGTASGGEQPLQPGLELAVGQVGIVGHVAASGEGYIAPDVRQDPLFLESPDLPLVRSEMALPLKVRDRVIGVLDIESSEPDAFSEQDSTVFQTLADQLALAIENARLLQQIQLAIRELGTAVGEIEAVGARQAGGAQDQSVALSQATSTIGEVCAIAQQTTERAQAVADQARRTARVSQAGQQALADVIEGMASLKERVESIAKAILALSERNQAIGGIVTTVNEIAAQSNMLALNAAVEAARAGVAGRGFAVVAQEVRNLAEQSRAATAQVKEILTQIQQDVSKAVAITEEGVQGADIGMKLAGEAGLAIHDLTESIAASTQAVTEIATAAGQQLVGMEEIVQAMDHIDHVTAQSLVHVREVEQATQELTRLSKQLRALVDPGRL